MKKQPIFRTCLQCLFILLSFSSLQAQWEYIGSPETGFVEHFATDDTRIYACATAGLFYSEDEGNTWTPIQIPDSLCTANEIYSEGGHLYLLSRFDLMNYETRVAAMYRSDDQGLHWKNILPQMDYFSGFLQPAFKGNTIVIVTENDLLVSTDHGDTFTPHSHPPSPVVKVLFHNETLVALSHAELFSSFDVGISWNLVHTFADTLTGFDVHSNLDTLYKIEQFLYPPSPSLYFSFSLDGGTTWTYRSTIKPILIWYPTIIGEGNDLFLYGNNDHGKIYHSSDAGASWTYLTSLLDASGYSFHDGILFAEDVNHVWISRDKGSTFEAHDSGFMAANVFHMSRDGNHLWINTSDELFEEKNSVEWEKLHNTQQIESNANGYLVSLIGDIPHRSEDGGETWVQIQPSAFGLTDYPYFFSIWPAGNRFFLSGWPNDWYSTDDGISWSELEIFWPSGEYLYQASYDDTGYYLIGDLSTVFRSPDGEVWEDITYDLWDPSLDLPIWIYSHNGSVFLKNYLGVSRLDEGSVSWESLQPLFPTAYFLESDAVLNCLAGRGNLLFGGVYGHGIFVSNDNGETWVDINLGLTDLQIKTLKVFNDTLYAGVDGGVWKRAVQDLQFKTYSGVVFNDLNSNGVQDQGEDGLRGVIVEKAIEERYSVTIPDGTFLLFAESDTEDSIRCVSPSPYAIVTNPPVIVTGTEDSLSFGVYFIPGIFDGSVFITHNTPFRPGFESTITLTYKNNGTETTDLDIKFVLAAELEYFGSSPEATFAGDTLTWIIQNVPALGSGNIKIDVKTGESVPIGTPILLYAYTDVVNDGDANQEDNQAYLTVEVVGSFDPNDKAVFPSGYISPAMIADTQRLEYTIRFQNTGNYPATFVRIQDTLSSNLDLASLQILAASHNFTWKLLPYNVLDFFLDNINLPDSTNDERNSHGFVKFAINAKPTLQLADNIENKAYIYFDFNVPVITNTVGSTVGFETGIKETGIKLFLTASPIPTKDYIIVTIRESVTDGDVILSLYDTKGALVKTKTSVSPQNIEMDIRDLPSGVYYLHARIGRDQGTISVLKN